MGFIRDTIFGLAILLGVAMCCLNEGPVHHASSGGGLRAFLWVLTLGIGTPVFYRGVIADSGLGGFGKFALTAAFVVSATLLFLLW